MRRLFFMTLALVVCLSAIAFSSHADNAGISGDYLEVRTASVFAGACHYNGELTTTGRDAIMAWNVRSGVWRGVDLKGVRVAAIIGSDDNLANDGAVRRSEIIVDQSASDSQATAILEALKAKYQASLGKLIVVRRAPLSFQREGKSYSVNSTGLVTINIEAMPNDECCKMPSLVWYAPLVQLDNRKVGHTTLAVYNGDTVGDRWQRSGENSAFYGSFSF